MPSGRWSLRSRFPAGRQRDLFRRRRRRRTVPDAPRRTDLPSGEPQAKKLVQRYVRAYFEEVATAMKSSGYRVGAYGKRVGLLLPAGGAAGGAVLAGQRDKLARLRKVRGEQPMGAQAAPADEEERLFRPRGRPQHRKSRHRRFWPVEAESFLSISRKAPLVAICRGCGQ